MEEQIQQQETCHTCHGTEIVGAVSGIGDEVVPPMVVDVFGENASLAHVARPLGANHAGVQLANHQSVRVGTCVRWVSEHIVYVLAISRFLKHIWKWHHQKGVGKDFLTLNAIYLEVSLRLVICAFSLKIMNREFPLKILKIPTNFYHFNMKIFSRKNIEFKKLNIPANSFTKPDLSNSIKAKPRMKRICSNSSINIVFESDIMIMSPTNTHKFLPF